MSTVAKKQDVFVRPFRRLEDFFEEKLFTNKWFEREFESTLPAVNIIEHDKSYTIELAASGLAKDDFKIKIDDDILTISAEKKEEKTEDKGKYTRKEFNYNSFLRSFNLPEDTTAEGINAIYKNGILSITLIKNHINPPKKTTEIKVD